MTGETIAATNYAPLIAIINTTVEKLKENSSISKLEDLSSVKEALSHIRSSFYKNASKQKYFAENEHSLKSLVSLMDILVKDVLPRQTLNKLDSTDEVESSLYSILSLCITTFVNMMAGNSSVRNLLWPVLRYLVLDVVSLSSPDVNHVGAALLHQFLIEEELKQKILTDDLALFLFPPLLRSYICEGTHSCFALFCLEALIEAPRSIPSTWEQLTTPESLLLLDILTTLVHKGRGMSIPFATVEFLQESFKRDADRVLALHDDRVTSDKAIIITRTVNFLSCAACSETFRNQLQKDKSLLISSVYLLKGVTEIGDTSVNVFSRIHDSGTDDDNVERHPVFGFKSDLIRLISGLVFRNKGNQDTVREIDGILLLLENSQYDARNPLIKEASIFALKNLLEENVENQAVISSLTMKGVAENKTLDQMGLGVSITDGKMSLHQK